jgi:hypothetical protein
MAIEVTQIEQGPVGLQAEANGLADIIQLNPPQPVDGFSEQQPPALNFLPRLSRAVTHIASTGLGHAYLTSKAMPHGVVVKERGYSERFLVTEPDLESGVDPSEATNVVLKPGLTELGDLGSHLRLHITYAEAHPDQRVITNPTHGVSHGGKVVTPAELRARRVEEMATIDRRLLPRLLHDGGVILAGTSLGSFGSTKMAEQDVAANNHARLNLEKLVLISSAVVALNVDESENFRSPDLDEEEHRRLLTSQFFEHLPSDLARMMLSNPRDVWACAPVLAAYALAPHKALPRFRAIAADFKNVSEGVDWSAIKQVAAAGIDINILGGSYDPLIIEQVPQWNALASLYPGSVQQRIVPGLGHLMTIDARRTVDELEEMELTVAA